MKKRRSYVTYVIAALGVAVLVVAGILLERPVREQWFLWKLDSTNEPEREVAAAKLAQMRSIRAVPKLARIFLQDPPPDYSVRALRRIGRPAVLPLIEALENDNENIRWYAAKTLGEIGAEAGVAAASLGGRLTDESQIVRVLSAVALGKIGPEAQTAIPALTAALHDEDQFVRERAAEALEKIRKSVEAR